MSPFLMFPIVIAVFLIANLPGIASTTAQIDPNDLKLELVQTIWRHGDRAALLDLFPIFEANWTFGGGGFGELTPMGMEEMNRLGWLFRRRYVDEMEFLSTRFKQREIYIRSTNLNRTIISAMSLSYGLFPAGAWNVQGVDYPTSVNWQQGFTFIPIHIFDAEQCDVIQNCRCLRLDELEKEQEKLNEYREANDKLHAFNRRIAAFFNVTQDPDNYNAYSDTWKCQRNWFNDTLYRELPFYNEQLFQEGQETNAPFRRFWEGQFENSSTIDGIDIGLELTTLKNGPLLNEIYNRGVEKLNCMEDYGNCTSYTKELKFYGYSAHDNMVYGLLVVLGIQELCKTIDGWPDYSSTVVFEFYSNPTTLERFFKILYRDNADAELADVTNMVPVCSGAHFCALQNLEKLAENFRPKPDFQTLCKTSLDESKSAISISSFSFQNFFLFLISVVLVL